MDKKINVLCVPSDEGGCGLHRSLAPHLKLDELYSDEFDVTIDYNPNWFDLDMVKQYDIIHFHKGLAPDLDAFHKALAFCKENNITTVMDVDDYWEVGQFHPLYQLNKMNNSAQIVRDNLSRVDYVTTTTDIFAKRLRKYNPNVKVFVNALDPEQMKDIKVDKKSDKIRIGFIMGSSHEHDMELVSGMANRLPKDILDKVQFVLCGYDLRGTMTERHPDGKIVTRPIRPTESVWFRFERNVTDEYRIVSPQYKDFLLKFMPDIQYPGVENEPYKRCWTKPVHGFKYMEHYNELDVLLVPLQDNDFNSCKSELKFVEAGMMNVAVVASNFGPYTIGSKSFFEKGGVVNEEGNCVLIDNKKAHKDWSKTIEKLVKNPEYITKLKENMHKHILENYDINKVTAVRADCYKQINKR
jgi:glycosyltransferase involved in cell wall biosynthesis